MPKTKKNAPTRHRKVIRDSIQGITKPAIRRLARRAGVKIIGGLIYEEIRGVMKVKLENLMRDVVSITQDKNKKTVTADEVSLAIQMKGGNLTYNQPKTKRKNELTFNIYINRVLKQVHPNGGINANALSQMNQMSKFLLEKLVETSRKLTMGKGKRTMTAKEVQTSVKLFLPGELSKHGISEGTKAVTMFNASVSVPKGSKKGESKSKRAGLTLSPSRVEKFIRGGGEKSTLGLNLGSGASIYAAAVIEYLVAEILELAGNAARDSDRVRITPRHIFLAIENDEELSHLFGDLGMVMSNAGLLSHIHSVLLPRIKTKETLE